MHTFSYSEGLFAAFHGTWSGNDGQVAAANGVLFTVCAALLKRLPYGMVPANRWVLWVACAFAVVLVWGVWSAACWLASRKAASSPPMNGTTLALMSMDGTPG